MLCYVGKYSVKKSEIITNVKQGGVIFVLVTFANIHVLTSSSLKLKHLDLGCRVGAIYDRAVRYADDVAIFETKN